MRIVLLVVLSCGLLGSASCFVAPLSSLKLISNTRYTASASATTTTTTTTTTTLLKMAVNDSDEEQERIMEESRLKVLKSRRDAIRSTLKFAEEMQTLRLENGWIPDIDPNTGKPISDSKAAVTLTAFCVAAGAVLLRLGGRAALVSAVGLDFAKDNPELKTQIDTILTYAHDMNLGTEALLFTAAWTAVKVLCFDAGGIVLALSSGILFGGVLQGAVMSATAATIGSSVCFLLAKLDTPVRKKALEIVEEYPSLRGIEKVVAQDGFKAILTLRLAPILPIPLGLYNYVYGVTNVPFLDFVAGIFLGSFKPYLLDSYLGYFGKSVIDGNAGDAMGFQDIILLVALGLSVLIGVFASQLAGETWEVVLGEVEAERKAKSQGDDPLDSLVTTEVAGFEFPEWAVDWQVNWGMAEERMMEMVEVERDARVWNYTAAEIIPRDINPALRPSSPEVQGSGFDFQKSVLDGLVLSPVLFGTFTKYADPMFVENNNDGDDEEQEERPSFSDLAERRKTQPKSSSSSISADLADIVGQVKELDRQDMLGRVEVLRTKAQRRMDRLETILDEKSRK